jgi:tetraprenyl-beta-curcumene synthase
VSAVADRGFLARAGWALVRTHAIYWSRVAPLVRGHLRHWEGRAAAIPDPQLRQLAQGKLVGERFNIEVAAMLATVSPTHHRSDTVRAIVALQIMYDYLDGLTEQPTTDPIHDGLENSKALLEAVCTDGAPPISGQSTSARVDGGYLDELSHTVRTVIKRLPGAAAVTEVVAASVARCAEAQVRVHAAPHTGTLAVEEWASRQAAASGLEWREWLFGAMASVVALHTLIVLSADRLATPARARELDHAYLPLCALVTMLDHLVDHERDVLTGERSYVDFYGTPEEFSQHTAGVLDCAIERVYTIRDGPYHLMLLSGVVAYYTSQPGATGEFVQSTAEQVQDRLRPLITPMLATLHAWRRAKRLRASI